MASFLVLILFGTVVLRTTPALYTGRVPLGWIDALFTATSAVCVTGLVVVDTAAHFTRAGQAFLLLLIQLGGLGMITITSLVIVGLGRRLSLRSEEMLGAVPGGIARPSAPQLVRNVVLVTLAIEAAGAGALFLAFLPHFSPGEAAWHAVFHAVSAFCNAGFSTFSRSLEEWARNPAVLWPIMALIVLGGLGFLTLEEVHALRRARGRGERFRLSLHSRLVLATTAALLVGGWLCFAALEWRGVLQPLPVGARIQSALFMSVTARTAGFNAVPYAEASYASNFLTMLLMSIGGSPGSTAGGLKTTTFVLIGLLAWSRFRGRAAVSIWSRTVPEEIVQRAVGLFVVAFGTMILGIFAYTLLEVRMIEDPFMWLMFEAVSAFNTVGLSLGATPHLGPASRVVTSVLMFLGRVGPLYVAAALAMRLRPGSRQYRFAHEHVSIG